MQQQQQQQQQCDRSCEDSIWDAFTSIGDQFNEALIQNEMHSQSSSLPSHFNHEFENPDAGFSTFDNYSMSANHPRSSPSHASHTINYTYPPTGIAIPATLQRRSTNSLETPALSYVASSAPWSHPPSPEPLSPFTSCQQPAFPTNTDTSYSQPQYLAPTSNPTSFTEFDYGFPQQCQEPNSWMPEDAIFDMNLPPDMLEVPGMPPAPTSAPFQNEFVDMSDARFVQSRKVPEVASPASVASTASSTKVTRRRKKHEMRNAQYPHTCPHCKAGFTAIADLKHHCETHTPYETRQFACHFCQQRFRYPKDLVRHATLHNKDAPRFYCPFADCKYHEKGFVRTDHLKRHCSTQHHHKAASRTCGPEA